MGKPAHNKQVHPEITCEICEKVFTVKPYMAKNRRFCSLACMGIASRGLLVGEKSPLYSRVEHACKTCGKIFMVKAGYDARGRYQYCSKECRYPPHVEINCKWCNEPFKVTPGAKERGRKQFCSDTCKGSYQAYILGLGLTPTSIEVAVRCVLTEIGIQFEEQKQIGYWLADFYLPNHNLVLECDGDYWHSIPKTVKKDTKRDKWMKANGYKVLRLTEHAIKDNAYQCVVDGLAQQGIAPAIQQLRFFFD